MRTLSRPEAYLLAAVLAALALACWGPAVAQHDHYHAFADQRTWLGVPCAMDVLSNLPFAVAGVWGLVVIGFQRRVAWDARWALAAVFFAGLLVTCRGLYGVPLAAGQLGAGLGPRRHGRRIRRSARHGCS